LYVLMARTYLAGGHREAAGLLLLRASKMNKADPECRRALAFLAMNQGKPFDSIRWLSEVQELTPDDFEVAKEIVRLHIQNRQTKAAEKVLVDFSSSHPEHIEAIRELARFYIQVDRNEEKAVQYGKAIVEVAPTAENMAMLASVFDAFDRLDEAIDAMSKAVELAPTNASYQQGVALLRETLIKKKIAPETKP
jgi:Flp pilus assembly protein TadD